MDSRLRTSSRFIEHMSTRIPARGPNLEYANRSQFLNGHGDFLGLKQFLESSGKVITSREDIMPAR